MQQRNSVLATSMAIGALLTAAVVLVGCGGSSTDVRSPPGGTPNGTSLSTNATPSAVVLAQKAGNPVDPAIVAADNGFGLRLLDTLLSGSDGGNVAISPLSVALALQVLYNGAAGTTQTAMAQTLQLGNLSTQALNSDNAALQASLINPDPKVQLTIANSLWMHLASNPVSSSFTQTDETYYGATLGDLSGAPDNVNAWAASETHDLITQILPPEPPGYYQQIIAIFANTIYFKGQWTAAFDVSQTAAAPFTLSDGTQTSAEMMHQTGSYPYLQETWHGIHFQAVQIPYGAGRLSMLIVLPDSGASLSSFVADMTVEVLNSWTAQLQTTSGSIALPRFTSTYMASLPPALTSLGMGIAFCTSNEADFSALAPLACISDVEHKTVVEVDESGTVAAGATTVTIVTTVVQAPQFAMTMDHPFFYAIQDDKTGELLFVGVLMNPS